jgi:hypothetical protein
VTDLSAAAPSKKSGIGEKTLFRSSICITFALGIKSRREMWMIRGGSCFVAQNRCVGQIIGSPNYQSIKQKKIGYDEREKRTVGIAAGGAKFVDRQRGGVAGGTTRHTHPEYVGEQRTEQDDAFPGGEWPDGAVATCDLYVHARRFLAYPA